MHECVSMHCISQLIYSKDKNEQVICVESGEDEKYFNQVVQTPYQKAVLFC